MAFSPNKRRTGLAPARRGVLKSTCLCEVVHPESDAALLCCVGPYRASRVEVLCRVSGGDGGAGCCRNARRKLHVGRIVLYRVVAAAGFGPVVGKARGSVIVQVAAVGAAPVAIRSIRRGMLGTVGAAAARCWLGAVA